MTSMRRLFLFLLVPLLLANAPASAASVKQRLAVRLFGETVGKEQRDALAARYDRRSSPARVLSEPRTGAIYAPAIVAAPERLREVPRHNFHPFIIGGEDDE